VLSVRDDGTYILSHVTLTVHAPEIGAAGPALIEDAKRYCAYSNATRGHVALEVTLV
jgi:organic hydroperoxide reductase OsmC/OhrA